MNDADAKPPAATSAAPVEDWTPGRVAWVALAGKPADADRLLNHTEEKLKQLGEAVSARWQGRRNDERGKTGGRKL